MQARRLVSPVLHEMIVEDHEVPDRPPPGAILAEAAATLISAGTEIANYQGRTAHRLPDSTEPYYPGYSFAGTVIAVGEGVRALRARRSRQRTAPAHLARDRGPA